MISLFPKFGYDCRSCVYCFTIQYLEYENQLFELLGSEILFFEVPKVSSLCYFAISFMGTFILVSVHIILIVALPCLFGEAKPC